MKNLAFCSLDTETLHIDAWEVFDLQARSFEDTPVCLIRELDKRRHLWESCDRVVIERQPTRNRKMSVVQHVLHVYFLIRANVDAGRNVPVHVVSAFHKLSGLGLTGKNNYYQRKKASVEIACRWLVQHPQSESVHKTFEGCKKKDDLADCLNQALACSRAPLLERHPSPARDKFDHTNLRPRRPTETQKRRGYSASNVYHFFKESEDFGEAVRKDKKLSKAVVRYFGNLESCMQSLTKPNSQDEKANIPEDT